MKRIHMVRAIGLLALSVLAAAMVVACSSSTETIVETVVVEKEVIKEVQVAGEVVEVEVEKIVTIKGDTKIETIVEKVVETVKGEKEIILQTVVVAATAVSAPAANAPDPQSGNDTVEIVAANKVGLTMSGLNNVDAPDGPFGIAEGFFQPCGPVGADIVCPVLAETWEVASDLSKVTVTLKKGVQFHGDWGEMTADDVVWSFNDLISTASVHNQSGDYSANFGEMIKIDDYTVEIPIKTYTVVWNQSLFNTFAGTNGTFSKKAFDEKGKDWVIDNVIATGPYMMKEFKPQEVISLESFAGHHTQPAPMKFLNMRDVPEESTRLAMLKNGQADIADISLKRINDLREMGFRTSDSGKASQMAVIMAGNYWEEHDYNCSIGQVSVQCPDIVVGTPELVPSDREGYTPDAEHPWIGEYGNAESMERARKVRQAMALALDTKLMNETLLDGLGWDLYMNSFSTRDPNWNSKWEWSQDIDEANRLLDEAGYPAEVGRNKYRFQVNLYATPHAGGPGGTAGEIQSAIGAMWTAVGIPTTLERHDYSVWRPTVVERSQNQPFLSACGGTDARDSVPWDFPKGVTYSSLSRGGFSCAMEIPFVLEKQLEAAGETDRKRRVEINTELAEFYAQEWLVPGITVVPSPLVWNPKKIKSWEMRANASGTHIVSLDTIIPAN